MFTYLCLDEFSLLNIQRTQNILEFMTHNKYKRDFFEHLYLRDFEEITTGSNSFTAKDPVEWLSLRRGHLKHMKTWDMASN